MPTSIAPQVRQRARRLRREMSPVEGNLWSRLKTLRRSHGLHFRRQVPIWPFTADFACLKRRLVIEVDGSSHDGAAAAVRDAGRDSFLREQGFRMLRVSNVDVMSNSLSVIETIIRETEG